MVKDNIPRRDVLKSIGASSVALGGATGLASADTAENGADPSDITVTEISGKDRKSTLKRLKKEDDTKILFKLLKKEDLRYNREEAQAWEVTEANGEKRTMAYFPFSSTGKQKKRVDNRESGIMYTGINSLSSDIPADSGIRNVEAFQVGPDTASSDVSVQGQSGSDVEIKRTIVEDGGPKTMTKVKSSSSGSDRIGTQNHDENCYCYQEYEDCENVNYTCVAKKVSAGIGSLTACYGCIQTSGILNIACFGCTNAVGASAVFDINCETGTDCVTKNNCIQDEAVGNQIC